MISSRRRQFARYFRLFRTLAVDSLWRFRYQSAWVLFAGLLGYAFEINAFGLAITYAGRLEAGETIEVLGRSMDARTSVPLLIGVAGIVLVMLVLAALLNFGSGRAALRLRKRYEVFASHRALHRLGTTLQDWSPPDEPEVSDSTMMKVVRRDARYAGRIVVTMIGIVVPAIVALAMLIWLCVLNTLLTGILLALLIVAGVFLYITNVRAARASLAVEKATGGATRVFRQAILRLKNAAAPLPDDPEWLDEKVIRHPDVRAFLDAYEERLMATPNAAMVVNTLNAVSFFVILTVMGIEIIRGHQGWGELLLYLLALLYCLNGVKQIAARLTGINRFYPQVKRYFSFIESTTPDEERAAPARSRLVVGGTSEAAPAHELTPGQPLAIVGDAEPNRYTLLSLMASLTGEVDRDDVWFHPFRSGLDPGHDAPRRTGTDRGRQRAPNGRRHGRAGTAARTGLRRRCADRSARLGIRLTTGAVRAGSGASDDVRRTGHPDRRPRAGVGARARAAAHHGCVERSHHGHRACAITGAHRTLGGDDRRPDGRRRHHGHRPPHAHRGTA